MISTDEQIIKSIYGSLRYERKQRGYTQASLGEKIGRNQTTINAWEGESGSIPLIDAWKIADVYGISLDKLAGRSTF